MFVVLQIVGMLMLILGCQGVLRLLFNHLNGGLLGWLPGGFPVWMIVYVVVAVAGLLLGGWANDQAKKRGQLKD